MQQLAAQYEMGTNVPSLDELFAPYTKNPVHQHTEIPGSWKYRMAAPVLFAMIGTSLGTLAGISVGMATTPGGSLWSAASANISAAESYVRTNQEAAFVPMLHQVQPEAPVQAAVPVNAAANQAEASAPVTGAPDANQTAGLRHSQALHLILAKATSARTGLQGRRIHGIHRRLRFAARQLAHAAPAPSVSPSNITPESLMMADEQMQLSPAPRLSNLYVEGDFTVASYDATAGTIETNDGRTFAVGAMVVTGSTGSWNEDGSDVHYRCTHSGSCTLSAAGMIASNARQI